MDPISLGKLAVDYGLGIGLSAGLATYLGWLSKQLVEQQRLIMIQSEKREERLAEIVNNALHKLQLDLSKHDDRAAMEIQTIGDLTKQLKDDISRQWQFHHDEHNKMIELLNNLIMEFKAINITLRREQMIQ